MSCVPTYDALPPDLTRLVLRFVHGGLDGGAQLVYRKVEEADEEGAAGDENVADGVQVREARRGRGEGVEGVDDDDTCGRNLSATLRKRMPVVFFSASPVPLARPPAPHSSSARTHMATVTRCRSQAGVCGLTRRRGSQRQASNHASMVAT